MVVSIQTFGTRALGGSGSVAGVDASITDSNSIRVRVTNNLTHGM